MSRNVFGIVALTACMYMSHAWQLFAQAPALQFKRFEVEDGFSSVNCIHKDRKGFMWFGGTHGLYRYDGYDFKIFTHKPGDKSSLSSDNVTCMYEDSKGFLWVGTQNGGLNKYDPYKETFTQFRHLQQLSTSLSHDYVTDIQEDRQGNLWVSTLGGGVNVFSPTTYSFKHFTHSDFDAGTLANDEVFDVLVDRVGNIWVTTNRGSLDLFDPRTQRFSHYTYHDITYKSARTGQHILEDTQGNLWIGTEGDGLYKFNLHTKEFIRYKSTTDGMGLGSNVISDLKEGRIGELWIATDGGGLNYFNTRTGKIIHYQHDPYNEGSPSNNSSYSLYVDDKNNVWLGMGDGIVNVSEQSPFTIYSSSLADPHNNLSFRVVVSLCIDADQQHVYVGTGGGGLDVLDLKTRRFRNYNSRTSALSSDLILSVNEDRHQNIWIGTFLGGLSVWNPRTGKFMGFKNIRDNPNSLVHDHVFDVTEDHDGLMWIGTYGGGLDAYDPEKKSFTHFQYSSTSTKGIGSNVVLSTLIDRDGQLWIGTFGAGLQRYDKKTNEFISYNYASPGDEDDLRQYAVHNLMQDKQGHIWLSTDGGGLIKLDKSTGHFTAITTREGMPSNAVYGSIEWNGIIWCSTNRGIVRYDPVQQRVHTFTTQDGLPTNDFEAGDIVKTKEGELFFASKKGLVSFFPDRIIDEGQSVQVALTGLRVLNEPVEVDKEYGGQVLLKKAMGYTKELTLPFGFNTFSLEFATPGYDPKGKIKFRYRMGGLDKQWIVTDALRRVASYSSVPDGTYVFEVQATNNNQWSAPVTKLAITIPPPLWRSVYAKILYAVLFLLILYFVVDSLLRRMRLKAQLALETYKHERDTELYMLKVGFFTNISHELRTSLTLILGPLTHLIQKHNAVDEEKNQLLVMQRNGKRLLHLINQLLDFRKVESGTMHLQVAETELNQFLQDVVLSFREFAREKNITLQYQSSETTLLGWIDAGKLEISVYNLLSNALKFTAAHGSVTLAVKRDETVPQQVIIEITDTGKGIEPVHLKKIFDPFYQQHQFSAGTGIGLTIAKSLVELHHGTLTVRSTPGEGSCFTITLPVDENRYEASEKVSEAKYLHSEDTFVDADLSTHSNQTVEDTEADKVLGQAVMLIVEDNAEIREYIRTNFREEYKVLEASNGEEGCNVAFETIPDIIISDVMMERMDGIELCAILKNDERTSHIPVILLTARTVHEFQLSGLSKGADDYVTKPFEPALLQARVRNLVMSRKKLREKFNRELVLKPKDITIANPDEIFLSRLVEQTEMSMENPEFSVTQLASLSGMSHSVLYRKVLALTGMTVNDFIKSIRLQRAAQLLVTGVYNVNEISDKVGFSNSKYFSTCFKAKYGKSPSEYMKENSGSVG